MATDAYFNPQSSNDYIDDVTNWTLDEQGLVPISGGTFPDDFNLNFNGTVGMWFTAQFSPGGPATFSPNAIVFPANATVQVHNCLLFDSPDTLEIRIQAGGNISIAPEASPSGSFPVGPGVSLHFLGDGTIEGLERYTRMAGTFPPIVVDGVNLYINDIAITVVPDTGVSALVFYGGPTSWVTMTNGGLILTQLSAAVPLINDAGSYPIIQSGPAGLGDDGELYLSLKNPIELYWSNWRTSRLGIQLVSDTDPQSITVPPSYEATGGVAPCLDQNIVELLLAGGGASATTITIGSFVSTSNYGMIDLHGSEGGTTLNVAGDATISCESFIAGNLSNVNTPLAVDFSAHTVNIEVTSLQLVDLSGGGTEFHRGDGTMVVNGFFNVSVDEWTEDVAASDIEVNPYDPGFGYGTIRAMLKVDTGTWPTSVNLNSDATTRATIGPFQTKGDLTLTAGAEYVYLVNDPDHGDTTEALGAIDLSGTPILYRSPVHGIAKLKAGTSLSIDDFTRVSGVDIRESTAKPANARRLYNMDWGRTYGFDFRRNPV
jgi:hypothetical protein